MGKGLPIFDARARADALSAADLSNLAYFGVRAVSTSAHDGFPGSSVEDIEEHFDQVAKKTVPRLRAAGMAGYAGLGIPAAKIPWLGLEALLARLPAWLGLPEVVSLSGVGLHRGGKREEEVLLRQCELAGQLRLPLVLAAPAIDRERHSRRTLAVIRELDLSPDSVLVTGGRGRDIVAARACGYQATLGAMDPGDAAALVARLGPEGLLASSDIGEGRLDPLVPARLVGAMEQLGLSRAVIRRVAFDNAAAFYGVEGEPPMTPSA